MAQLDSAETNIETNNQNTILNASKDRLRVKKRKDEIEQMRADFEKNVKVEPEEMQKAVRDEVEVALLRMTEKKIMAEMELEKARQTIQEKDIRIAELENIILQLQGQNTQSIAIRSTNEIAEKSNDVAHAQLVVANLTQAYYEDTILPAN